MPDNTSTGSSGTIGLNGSSLGTPLMQLLTADSIEPGSDPGYQTAKTIYLYHPLGAKIVETPVKMAQSQPRELSVEAAPDMVVREFERVWEQVRADYYIRGAMYQPRIYGAGALVCGAVGDESSKPLELEKLHEKQVYFSVFDPLNVAGSLVLDQNPNSPMYQKHGDIASSGVVYHRSRSCVMFNEQPVYIAYTPSAFGFSGRSVYQRALFPLKSFIQTMITDDMVSVKAGLLVAMIKSAGSVVNRIMQAAAGIKRILLKTGTTGNVLSIEPDEKIESIDLQNIDKAMVTARSNIIKNIATACDMPAQILEQESFAEGFGEGTEDTKNVIRYVNGVRKDMQPLYAFMDRIVQHLAWTPEFFAAVAAANPGLYDGQDFRTVFYAWRNGFTARWPNLLEEPESEQARMEKVKLEGLVSIAEIMLNHCDPDNAAAVIQWVVENCNEFHRLFVKDLQLDEVALREHIVEELERRREGEDQAAAGGAQEAGGGNVRPRLSLTARGDSAQHQVAQPPQVQRRRQHYTRWWG